jgi:hypothetical protein
VISLIVRIGKTSERQARGAKRVMQQPARVAFAIWISLYLRALQGGDAVDS